MTEETFGFDNGKEVKAITLENKCGMRVTLISYGARIKDLFVPDRNGNLSDVSLGYNELEGYMNDKCYFGATIGRTANRIEKARFCLNGKEYEIAKNDGEHNLHGGRVGFDKRNWDWELEGDAVIFSLESPAGEEGYPGCVKVTVTYRLTDDNALKISYTAVSDQDTPLSLTNHCYFNLAGAGNIYGHELTINASRFTPDDKECVPTGEILKVKGTPMDFTVSKTIGKDINSDFEQIKQFNGYDHNYVLNGANAAEVYEPVSGRRMFVETDLPCMQLYTANSTDASGKAEYKPHCSFCLETQFVPNAVNENHLAGGILKAGGEFFSETAYRFEW